MNKWPHDVESWGMHEILEAVDNAEWQRFRMSLKKQPTTEKLVRLDRLLKLSAGDRKDKCRIDNYINALKRGGQLNMNLEVVR